MKISSYNCDQKHFLKFMERIEGHINKLGGVTVDIPADEKEAWRIREDILPAVNEDHEWLFVVFHRGEMECLRQMGLKLECEMRVWYFKREQVAVNIQDIYYIETYKRKTTVYTEKNAYRIRADLSKEEEALSPKGFVRVHRGYLVKKDKIKGIDNTGLTLINGTTLSVSRRYKKKLYMSLTECGIRISK